MRSKRRRNARGSGPALAASRKQARPLPPIMGSTDAGGFPPKSTGPLLVLLGTLGRLPYAGVAWQVLHYLEGFRRAGCDVYYLEDTGDWPYDAEQETITDDCSFALRYINGLLSWCGMEDRWMYRSGADGQVYGPAAARFNELLCRADVLVNLSGATVLQDVHLQVPTRIYLETDPVLPQIEIAEGREFTIELLASHTHHFSYGENFGAADCQVPIQQFHYWPTRQPVVLDWWESDGHGLSAALPHGACFTTIANWQQSGKDIVWRGETYSWSKHSEFLKLIDLPRHTRDCLELALATRDPEVLHLLDSQGWKVVDALVISKDIFSYRDFIWGSRGEFTVAKDQNIRLRSGWFSDRSATYLASGRPVITQDTAFGNILPTGCGLFSFRTRDDVIAALDAIRSDYKRHSAAALEIARDYFAAEKVVGHMLQRAGIDVPGAGAPAVRLQGH